MGHGGHAGFGQKLLNTQHCVGRCAGKSPIIEIGKYVERVFKKNSLKPYVASHTTTSWYTDTDGFLEHSPSGGSQCYKGSALQKIILVLGGSPLVIYKD